MRIVFLGKYNQTEILTGPEKVAKRIFHEVLKDTPSCVFVEYFFKQDRETSFWSRLFGKEIVARDGAVVRLGIIRLFLFLLTYRPNIIHVITAERFTLSVFLYRFALKGRIIVTVHGIVKHEKTLFSVKETAYSRFKDLALESLIMRYCDELIFVSEQELSLAKLYYDIAGTRAHIIPNGIDERFSESRDKSFSGSALRIVLYERGVSGSSNTDELIGILSRCSSPFLSLFVICEQYNTVFVEGRLKVYRTNKMNTEGLRLFLDDKHLFINNAIYDSFSMMTVECMAAGVVPVVADSVGMSYLITNGLNGFVYNRKQPEEVLKVVEGIISGEHDLQTISDNARRIYTQLRWTDIAQAYRGIYLK